MGTHVLRELWDEKATDPEVKTTYQYVPDLSDRLKETCDLAKKELLKARDVQKPYFDRLPKLRKFSVGDKCLVLLSTPTNILLAQWKGLYEVLEKVHDLNYILSVDGKHKRFHLNMLKEYFTSEAPARCDTTYASEKVKFWSVLRRILIKLHPQRSVPLS